MNASTAIVRKQEIQARAIDYLAGVIAGRGNTASMASPLYGPDNRPLAPSIIQYTKKAASQTGSMRNWNPRQISTDTEAIREREVITGRISDLIASDPHAAGVVNKFPLTVIGSGLTPYPTIDAEMLGITEEQATLIEQQQRLVYSRWSSNALAGRRMSMGAIQFIWERCLMQFGESFTLPMMDKTRAGYKLCLRLIHPLRVKTPVDKRNTNVIDGIEIDDNGAPTHVWIKRAVPGRILPDTSANFIRVPVMFGHRFGVIHDFIQEEPEQMRGFSPLAPALKGFRDLSDFLDAELVSNVVTAAFALFISVSKGSNPLDVANNASTFYDTRNTGTKTEKTRYAEMNPGGIMYGNEDEMPHPISAARPGATFQPFVREIKKSFAHGLGIPYPVAFNDVDGVSFAGFRSAMLEAWRVFTFHRQHIGQGPSQISWKMLQEEAFLQNDLTIPGGAARFYKDMDAFCATEWYGAPKGDIEPYSAIKADVLAHESNFKTQERIILEYGEGNPANVVRKIEQEKKDAVDRGIRAALVKPTPDSEVAAAQKTAGQIKETQNVD